MEENKGQGKQSEKVVNEIDFPCFYQSVKKHLLIPRRQRVGEIVRDYMREEEKAIIYYIVHIQKYI